MGMTSFALVTVTCYPGMECWIWTIYFLKTQRNFNVTFYASDLFNMNQEILNLSDITNSNNPEVGLWKELIKRSDLELN